MGRGTRRTRRIRPMLEGLEHRALLNGTHELATPDRRFAYTTPEGARVHLTLRGPGSLAGTSTTGGVLHIIYNGTNTGSALIGTVSGGRGRARLGSIRDADVPLESLTGIGGNLLGRVELSGFDLVDGGNINLLGGVNVLSLNSVGRNTQLHLRDTPLQFPEGTRSNTSETIPVGFNTNNGQNTPINEMTVPGLGQADVRSGRIVRYRREPNGGRVLESVGGSFTPGPNLIEPQDPTKPGPPPAPPGVVLRINRVNGAARNGPALDRARESIHPELVDAALIDVQGNVQSFRARDVRGLVFNDAGNLNLVQIQQVTDSTIIGLPISHIAIGRRSNTTLLSSRRLIGARNGVTVNEQLRQVGPLALP